MEIAKAGEAAHLLGISKKRLRALTRDGLVPLARRTKPVRYSVPKVFDWLEKMPTVPTPTWHRVDAK